MLDAEETVVASSGTVSVAPLGSTVPTGMGTLNAAFESVGFVTEDGVLLRDELVIEDEPAWQLIEPDSKVVTSRLRTLQFDLEQWNRQNVELAFAGGAWSVPSAGVYRYDPPADGSAITEFAVVIDWVDDDADHRLVVQRAILQEGTETRLSATGLALLPISLLARTPISGTRAWYHLTNDDYAFAYGS